MRPRSAPLAALVLATSLLGAVAHAQPSAADRARAAVAFDDAVAKFGRAEFDDAARAFLAADDLVPSTTAITNAMEAAGKASDFLLVATAAQRAIRRGVVLVQAREALADAATRLARIELSCSTGPCSITIDGAPAGPPEAWVLPGTHHLEARSPAGVAYEQLSCVAGATYRAAFSPAYSAPDAGEQGRMVAPPAPSAQRPDALPHHGLPRGVFFTGVGVTAVLAGVTVWSGVDALAAKHALTSPSSTPAETAVLSDARRTDWILLGAGLAGVATAVVGIWLTDWHPASVPPVRAALVPLPGGAALSTTLAF